MNPQYKFTIHSMNKIATVIVTVFVLTSTLVAQPEDVAKKSAMGGPTGGINMSEMMRGPKESALYPTMINSSNPSEQERQHMEQQAKNWIVEGNVQLKEGAAALTIANQNSDISAMLEASELVMEGRNVLQSGESTYKALGQGMPPDEIALSWFKSQLNMNSRPVKSPALRILGMTPFQVFVCLLMLVSIVFALFVYMLRMRRAYQLIERLEASRTLASDSLGSSSGAGGQPRSGLLSIERKQLCKLRLSRTFPETPDVKTFRFVSCDNGPIPFSYLPGQFMTLSLPVKDKPIKRSYTISSSPTQGYYCEISVKREEFGAGSRYLHDVLREGDVLDVRGPSGKLTFTGKESDSVVLVGGGVGITPMMSVTRALGDMGWDGEIILIVCCSDPDHFIFGAELESLKRQSSGLSIFLAMSQIEDNELDDLNNNSSQLFYHSGRLSKECLVEWVPDIVTRPRIHLCASPQLMDAIETMLEDLGVPKGSLKTESFGSQEKPHSRQEVHSTEKSENAVTIEFRMAGKSTVLEGDETILETAERIGVDMNYSCRVGGCGECSVKMISGDVDMDVDDALDPRDIANNIVLACQARPTSNVIVEA
jgi:ferredoxin-NADP reductase